MALSDSKILSAMARGDIVISPFVKENLSTSSYDVTLGEYYFSEQNNGAGVYNPYNRVDVDRVWGTEPHRAKLAKEVFDAQFSFVGISEHDQVILLSPGETVLAHTNEFIGGKDSITTMMKARSSLGRNFIEICKCAGWGDVGYINRWTMEITNNSRYHHIPLVVGRRVAQIIFFETGLIRDSDYARRGKYQTSTDLSDLREQWDPHSMLPKMYNDREIDAV